LMQGKQSSTTPSPAGPAPIPRWRLDHGRLRLGRRRPWLGLLRLRSGHARADDDEDVRLRPPPQMALPQRLQFLPSSSLSDFGATADGLGKSPKAAAGKVKVGGWLLMGGQLGFPGPGGRCRCGTGVCGLHPVVPALQGAAMGPARCSRHLPALRHVHGIRLRKGKRKQRRG
jgi:hypothetical protein